MIKDIWIIGVDPPCPRCDLMRQRVERIAEEKEVSFNVKNLVYSNSEAIEFAKSKGKEIGTAKHVADKAGIEVDWNHIYSIVKDPPSKPEDFDIIDGPALQWSPEMDEALSLCQEKADTVGILMTPVLIVGNEVMHHGSVPSLTQLRSWIA